MKCGFYGEWHCRKFFGDLPEALFDIFRSGVPIFFIQGVNWNGIGLKFCDLPICTFITWVKCTRMMGKMVLSVGVFLAAVTTLIVLWPRQQLISESDVPEVRVTMETVVGEVSEGEKWDSNLVRNGSFEEGYWLEVPGWNRIGKESPGIYAARGYKGANATHGRQALDVGLQGMGGGNEVSQEVPTEAGVTYSLSFDWGSEYAWGVSGEVVFQDSVTNITIALEDSKRVVYPKIDETRWIVHRLEHAFRANGPGTLTFRQIETGNVDADFGGLVIDHVVIDPRH
jgi:hypothetical protein